MRLLKKITAAVALGLVACYIPATAQTPVVGIVQPAYSRTEDVVYGRKLGVALTLDVFQPRPPANGAAIIWLVSGGWKSGHDRIDPDTYAAFLERGYTVFAAVHGSQPKYVISEIVQDIHRAVRFIRANAERWKIDPRKIGIAGGSAGGHLSLTIATQGGAGAADAVDTVDRESSAVQAVACFFPPTDFLNYGREGEDATGIGPLKAYLPAFGPEATTREGRQRLGAELSPARSISAALPPTLIIHGDADTLVPLQQSELFVQRAKAVNATIRLIVKPGLGHGLRNWPEKGMDYAAMADWFDQYLRSTGAADAVAPIQSSK